MLTMVERKSGYTRIGLIRQYFPKGTDFSRISHQAVARVEQQLNERLRRRLDYRTPEEVLANKLCCD